MKHFSTTILFLLILSVSVTAQTRVGFMNPQTVLDHLPEKEAIERQLNRFLDQREAEFQEKAMEYQNALATLQQEAQNLSDSERRRRQQDMQRKEQELQQFQFRVEQELEQRQAELLGPVLQEMNNIIEELALELNLDYVLNEATAEGEMFLLFVAAESREELDLTDKVIARMLN
ncbi:OmpH family outer membrane protein [Balneolaceae bacterium ANBcel3]|nr:OmpH family outer membrane protein [Balneolaceae bacterium ANBcel3]